MADANEAGDPSEYEETHVHSVYESIADHFSATRYAPWPLVARFLAAQPAGSVGLDVGCGNGKYLSGADGADGDPATPRLFMLGSDRSTGLAGLARAKHAQGRVGADVLLADSLALPIRDACADFAVCIAVVHHLSTRARRRAAVQELLRCVRRADRNDDTNDDDDDSRLSGRVLLYVWALEQASSRRGWTAGGEQDLLVPWVKTMKDKDKKDQKDKTRQQPDTGSGDAGTRDEGAKTATDATDAPTFVPPVFHRYYHLYRAGELEADVVAAGGRVVASGYERDNWWVVCT